MWSPLRGGGTRGLRKADGGATRGLRRADRGAGRSDGRGFGVELAVGCSRGRGSAMRAPLLKII
jgi:hypothetical protein